MYLLRLFLASATMAGGVAALHLVFDDLLTLILGIPVGIALFVINLKLWRVFAEPDPRHLQAVSGALPARVRVPYTRVLGWVMASRRAQAA
jgi:hypothetical protein